ncbi:MAG: ABC transporter ATP-binding protein [Bacteroidota bacterium]
MVLESKHSTIEVHDLSIGYTRKKRKRAIATDLQFECSQGSLISLVGANGIGKSTLLRTLSGMQKPLAGSVLMEGKDLKDYPLLSLANVLSVVLTDTAVSKNLSVGEFVSLGRQPHTNWMGTLDSRDTEKIHWALQQTDTHEIREKKCFELSDGQFQRVAIARALAQDTPIILLDEPTTHLDLYHRAVILKLLKRLSVEAGKTILFSTHEIDLAIQLSDQMLVMTEKGTYSGSPKQFVQEGIFKDLFPEDTIFFDEETGRFTIKN